MSAPLPAYQGNQPYVFICYSHADTSDVFAEVRDLQDHGLKAWYDDAIRPGSIWRDELAQAIDGAALFLFYVSPRSIASENCLQEVDFALDLGRRILCVFLEETTLPAGLSFRLGNRQALLTYELGEREGRVRVIEAVRAVLSQEPTDEVDTSKASAHRAPQPVGQINVVTRASEFHDDAEARLTTRLLPAVARYIMWNGGPFKALGDPGHIQSTKEPLHYLVELRVSKAARVSVTWQMQHHATGEVIWSGRHEESEQRYAENADRIADMIAEGVIEEITSHRIRNMDRLGSDVLSYWDLLLKGDLLRGMQHERRALRRELIDRAIAMYPDEAPGHAVLANLVSWELMNGVSANREEDTVLAGEAARRAVAIERDDPFVLVRVGTTYTRLGDYDRGIALCQRAHSLAPSIAAKERLAMSLCFAGKPDEAIPLFEEIMNTMPAGHLFKHGRLAVALTQAGELERALDHSTQCIIHFPDDFYGWVVHANLLSHFERNDEAQSALAEARRLFPDLKLDAVIAGTEASYGRSSEQCAHLTGGLRKLSNPEGSG